MSEILFVPLQKPEGFMVDTWDNYRLMISALVQGQLEIAEDYPEHQVIVIFPLEEL